MSRNFTASTFIVATRRAAQQIGAGVAAHRVAAVFLKNSNVLECGFVAQFDRYSSVALLVHRIPGTDRIGSTRACLHAWLE